MSDLPTALIGIAGSAAAAAVMYVMACAWEVITPEIGECALWVATAVGGSVFLAYTLFLNLPVLGDPEP